MKNITKKLTSFLAIVFIVLATRNSVLAISNINLVINGEKIVDQAPVIQNETTLVPLRVISEKLGYDVTWNTGATGGKVTIKKDNKIAEVYINTNEIHVFYDNNNDHNYIKTEVNSIIINGKTYVPLRAIGEAFGAIVDWDNTTKTVTVNTNKTHDNYYEYSKVTTSNINLVINGETIGNQTALIQNEKPLVPISVICEKLGYKNEKNDGTALIQDGSRWVGIYPNCDYIFMNGMVVLMGENSRTINNELYIPLNFIIMTFDAKVDWDNTTKIVTINAKKNNYINSNYNNSTSNSTKEVVNNNSKPSEDKLADNFVDLLNEYRQSLGLSTVRKDNHLTELANYRLHGLDDSKEIISHTIKGEDFIQFSRKNQDDRIIGEIITYYASTGDYENDTNWALTNFKESPGHNEIMINPYAKSVGVAVVNFNKTDAMRGQKVLMITSDNQ